MTPTALLTRPAVIHAAVARESEADLAGDASPSSAGPLASRWSDGPATVEELVARDIEAFSARVRGRAR